MNTQIDHGNCNPLLNFFGMRCIAQTSIKQSKINKRKGVATLLHLLRLRMCDQMGVIENRKTQDGKMHYRNLMDFLNSL